nr:hypothetical protein [Deltaproteobacteria bacterium]
MARRTAPRKESLQLLSNRTDARRSGADASLPAEPIDLPEAARGKKVLYVVGAPLDLVTHHDERFGPGRDEDHQISSLADMYQMCHRHEMTMHVISSHPERTLVRRGPLTLEHYPRPAARGLAYYRQDIAFGRHLLQRARELGAEVALVESGTVDFSIMSMLKLAGVTVIPIIHHALWATGHPPRRLARRVRRWANRQFFRHVADAVIS